MKLPQLLETGENEQIEFKASFDKEAIETLTVFVNTKGGNILIGVDDGGTVKGLELGRETLQNWNNQIKQSYVPSILPEINVVTYSDRQIAILTILECPIKPVCCKGKYFKRVNNSNHQLTLAEISDLHPLDDSPLTVLKKYELLKEDGQITNGCYLLFADSETMLTAIDLGRFASETIIKDSLTARVDSIW